MDSGNSGSLQSSSGGGGGGDEEFDSRGADSSPLSALLRPAPPAASSSSAGAFPLRGAFYSLQELAPSPAVAVAAPQASHWSSSFAAAAGGGGGGPAASSSRLGPAAGAGAATSGAVGEQAVAAPAPRGSRKRSRASRRAPTTVLTTDTSNFRAMVQEFTGIPSPPFAAAASLRTRFDHFFPSSSSPASLRSAAAAAASEPNSLPPYLLRPFAQKIPPSPFPPFASSSASPSSSNIGIANANANAAAFAGTTTTTTTTTAAGENYQLPQSALLGMQEHSYLSFQSLLSSQLTGGGGPAAKYPSQGVFSAGGYASTARLQEPAEFLAGGHVGLTHGLMGSDGLHLHPRVHGHGGDELSGLVGGASGSSNCKMNYSAAAGTAAAAELSAEKPSDTGAAATAAARGEGVDAWICTSE